jgi:hypothetical protein
VGTGGSATLWLPLAVVIFPSPPSYAGDPTKEPAYAQASADCNDPNVPQQKRLEACKLVIAIIEAAKAQATMKSDIDAKNAINGVIANTRRK